MAVLPQQSEVLQPGLDHFIGDRSPWGYPELTFTSFITDSGIGEQNLSDLHYNITKATIHL